MFRSAASPVYTGAPLGSSRVVGGATTYGTSSITSVGTLGSVSQRMPVSSTVLPATSVAAPTTYTRPATSVTAPATYTAPTTYAGGLTSTRTVASPTVFQSSPAVVSSPTVTYGGATTIGGSRPAKIISGGLSSFPTTSQTVISSGYAGAPVTYGGATRIVQSGVVQPNALVFGGQISQAAYEVKKHDPQLATLKQVKAASGLKHVDVMFAATEFKNAAMQCGGRLSRDQFMQVKAGILDAAGVQQPSQDVSNAVFDLFDKDDNDSVDMMEIICGVSLLCKGDEEKKVEAVFMMFDENGDGFVTVDEMYKFLVVVFKVVCTPSVMEVVNSVGVPIDSIEDMASATTLECFQAADLNHDGKLSLDEFKKWFSAPRNDPAMIFQPVKSMLQ